MKHSALPHVYVIVLNWNNNSDTIECVESLEKTSYPNFTIVLVDNGSTDDSEAILKGRFPGIHLIQNGRNLGFTGGMNAGIRHALQSGAEYILMLNNDTIVDPNAVAALVAAATGDSRIGILSSKILFYHRPDVIWYAGGTYNSFLGWGRHRGYGELDRGQYDRTEETKRPSGCSMMVSRAFCEKVGLLDERFFCYGEETDWAMRGKRAGFKVVYVPSSMVWHKVSKSTGGTATRVYLYYSVRNTLMCIDNNYPLPAVLRITRYMAVTLIFLLSLFTMKVPKRLGIRRIYQGFRDYFQKCQGEFREI